MQVARARIVVEGIEWDEPWHTRAEFLESLAALTALHRQEVQRRVTGANKPLFKLLWNAGSPARVEWMFNSIRMRARMSAQEEALLPSGTTSNEALHAEVNAWFKQTQRIHQATLRLKLQILQLSKLLAHSIASHRPTLRQLTSGEVLARAAVRDVWGAIGWANWCGQLAGGALPAKAHLPLHNARQAQAERVREWVRKRPSAVAPPKCKKRTPFSLPRGSEFKTAGVKSSIMKKPAALRRRPAAASSRG